VAYKAVFDPDLEQGGNTNIVARDDTTGSGAGRHRIEEAMETLHDGAAGVE